VAVWPPSVPGSPLEAQPVPSWRAEPASSRACHGWEKAIGQDVPHAVVTNVRVEPDCDQGSDSAVALHQFLLDLKVVTERAVSRLRVELPKLSLRGQ
jgi:hypothetical protein